MVSPIHDDDDNDESSIDTNEALFEMLGLNLDDGIHETLDEEEQRLDSTQSKNKVSTTHIQQILLPKNISRNNHPPLQCAAFTIRQFLNESECNNFLKLAESFSTGFQYITEASHTAPDGSTYSVKLQNPNPHKLAVFEHAPTMNNMWDSLKDEILPYIEDFQSRTNCGPPTGLNPRLRVLRYDSDDDDRFEPHFDATTRVGKDEISLLTVLLYLNDGEGNDFDGGETLFLDSKSPHLGVVKVTPSRGSVVIFEHDLYHSGAPLRRGTKYVLRTDILFHSDAIRDNNDTHDDEEERKDDNLSMLELCDRIGLLDRDKNVLENMGLLDGTIDAFCSPGITMMKMMLGDALDAAMLNTLVNAAFQAINDGKGVAQAPAHWQSKVRMHA